MEIKSCEQYVVDRLQAVEMLLDQERDNHERDVLELTEELKKTESVLADAQNLLDFIASRLSVEEYSNGYYLSFNNVWEQFDKEIFDRLVHELCLELPKKDEENTDA
jgi:hypothetical protein